MSKSAIAMADLPPTRCHIRHALDLLNASGLDTAEVTGDLGLAQNALDRQSGGSLPLADFFRIRSYIAARVRDETCNMSARQLLPGSTDFVMSHLPAEGTLADVMGIVARSYNLLHGGEYNKVEEHMGEVVFCIDDRTFPYTVKDDLEPVYFAMESTLLFLHALLTIVAPGQAARGLSHLSVRRLHKEEAPHLEYWSVPVRYAAARYEVAYKSEHAHRIVRFPPPERLTSDAIDSQIRRLLDDGPTTLRDMSGPVVDLVRELISQGTIEQSAVSDSLGMSPATLRRRLTAEGETFRNLRREILDREAKSQLLQGMSITTLSDRLGFSDVRSFNRAFKSWNGVTPKTFQDDGNVSDAKSTADEEASSDGL
ncbi:helix-turn-helix domain-containing protein [Parvularcula marina]|nr:helix-turn-helix transcriptional regulator [Parvularcula marina]